MTTVVIGANANATVVNGATFKIPDAKLNVPVVTFATEDSAKLAKQLSEVFKRPVYWSTYKWLTIKK